MKKYVSLTLSVLVILMCSFFAINVQATDLETIGENNTVISISDNNLTFDYQEKFPDVKVEYNGSHLTYGIDYTTSYTNNVNAGKGYVTVYGINKYNGSITKEFSISPCNFTNNANFTASLSYTTATYNGTALCPTVNLFYGNTILTENKDYTVAYSNNVNVGTGYVQIKGIGNFTGVITKSFTIKGISLQEKGKCKVIVEKNSLVYYNEPISPILYVSYNDLNGNSRYLTEGVDYTVTYSNLNKMGKANAKIRGIGIYSGTINKSFNIIPQKVSGIYISDITSSSLKINWSKISNVAGYQIFKYNSKKKKFEHLAFVSPSKTSYSLSKLSAAGTYRFKIRAYISINNKKTYGYTSNEFSSSLKPSQVSITSVTKSKNKLTVEWKKINCSGYEIFYSTDKKMKKGVKTIKVSSSKSSKTIKGINKSKRYYVKVRAYTSKNGKKLYGKKSALVSSYFSNVYATYYSYYVNNANRTNNLRIASKAISGTIIQPGETFSFNRVVGPRTTAKGYKDAHIFQGETVTDGTGGGVCQVASTMFNCALKANVKITERYQHSQRVAYVPLGRDAAIYGSAVDFKWTNNTKYAIKIDMTVKDGRITCTFYTCKKAKPKKVKLNVKQNGKNFTLKRYASNKVNYTAYSKY